MPYKDPAAQRAAHKRWYEANKATRQEQIREYKRKNAKRVARADALYRAREDVRAANTLRKNLWRAANREHDRLIRRVWVKRNRHRLREYDRRYRVDRREYNRNYYAANRDAIRYRDGLRYIQRRDGVSSEQYELMVALARSS